MSAPRHIFLLLIFLSAACSNSDDTIKVPLETSPEFGPFVVSQGVTFPLSRDVEAKGIPENIKEYVFRSRHMQPAQSVWYKYKTGELNKEQLFWALKRWKGDTTKLSDEYVDDEILFVIGTNDKDQRVIMVDANNDEDFSDDSLLVYEYPLDIPGQLAIRDSLPEVLAQYERYNGEKTEVRQVAVRPTPYLGNLKVNYSIEDEIENKYYLLVQYPQHHRGKATLNNIEFDIYLSSVHNPRPRVIISALGDSLVTEKEGAIPYVAGDIFNAEGVDYLIDSIDANHEWLTLKYLGENDRAVGVSDGFYMPEFQAVNLDSQAFSLEDHPGKFILLDFWGTWCGPCIALIPELKKIDDAFENDAFEMVSVAYDLDVEKVREFTIKENMDWIHLFVDRKVNNPNSLVEKLKITRYPTTVLISPDRKIVARNKEPDELIDIIKENLAGMKK